MTRLTLELPLPPSVNEMIALAKKRAMVKRRSLPIVYDRQKAAYETRCMVAVREQGYFPPSIPWRQWRIVAASFRLHNLRDPVELFASLKWPVDFLVKQKYVAQDSPRELLDIAKPEQTVDRKHQGVTVVIEEVA